MLKSRNENFTFLKIKNYNISYIQIRCCGWLPMLVDALLVSLRWLLFAFLSGQVLMFIGLILWTVWNDAIKPRLIPAAEIDRIADDIIGNFLDPEEEAFARHERAWYRSNGAEQTYWRRVRKAVRKRLEHR